MPKIFISYRREDSQWPAHTLYNKIRSRSANPDQDVFIDIDNIPLGVNFHQHIGARVGECDILLALIGEDWLDVRDEAGRRRLDSPDDFVRVEIGSALKRGIRVIPVLLDGTPIPSADELPEDIRELSLRNGVDVRRTSFEGDSDRLLSGIGLDSVPSTPMASKSSPPWGLITAALAVVAIAAAVFIFRDDLAGLIQPGEEPAVVAETPAEPGLPGRAMLNSPTLGIKVFQDGEAAPLRKLDAPGGQAAQTVAYVKRGPFEVAVTGSHWGNAAAEEPAIKWVIADRASIYDFTETNETELEQSIFHWPCTFAVTQFGSGDFYMADFGLRMDGALPCGNNHIGLTHFAAISDAERRFFVSDIKADGDAPNQIDSAERLYTVMYIESQTTQAGFALSTLMYDEIENLTLVFVDG